MPQAENNNRSASPCLGHLSCFNALTADQLEMINSRTRHIYYQKGETICKQGVYAPYVIFLTNGFAKIYLETERDRQTITHLAGNGDFISFSAVFNEEAYKYSASALTDCDLCLIEKDAVRQLLNTNSDFAFRIISRNWEIESRLLTIIKNISFKHMPGRLATAILYLHEKGDSEIFKHISRKDLAGFASINLESTVKLLKEFEHDGIISLEGKNIRLDKPEKLKNISIRG
ncbi:MAG: Crp/Fnr family transcriptional regulator [Bacteroidia bacterium]|nr:MAG: Crp/Fnr family transcriptional regulator [Bacteroidia bacterium]